MKNAYVNVSWHPPFPVTSETTPAIASQTVNPTSTCKWIPCDCWKKVYCAGVGCNSSSGREEKCSFFRRPIITNRAFVPNHFVVQLQPGTRNRLVRFKHIVTKTIFFEALMFCDADVRFYRNNIVVTTPILTCSWHYIIKSHEHPGKKKKTRRLGYRLLKFYFSFRVYHVTYSCIVLSNFIIQAYLKLC